MIVRLLQARPAVFFALVTGGVIIAIALSLTLNTPNETARSSGVDVLAAQIASKDTDGDGLKDWEESLWKTGINNADTDSDGQSDAAEVRAGRDPLIFGEGERKTSETANVLPASVGVTVAASEGTTYTDALSINLFNEYLRLQKQGGDATLESEEIAERLLASGGPLLRPERFTLSSLRIVQSDASSTAEQYRDDLERILAKLFVIRENELTTLTRYVEQGDESALAQFRKYIPIYSEVVSDLQETAVPAKAQNAHLAVLNALAEVEAMFEGMSAIDTDPLLALSSINQYERINSTLRISLDKLWSYFLVKGLTVALPN